MLKKRLQSFRYAFAGLGYLFRSQPNARIHLVATALAIGLALWLECRPVEWAALIFAMGLVLAAEAFNTALETLTDLVSPQRHKLAGRTKDLAAAGVLISALTAAAIGLFIFLPKIIARI